MYFTTATSGGRPEFIQACPGDSVVERTMGPSQRSRLSIFLNEDSGTLHFVARWVSIGPPGGWSISFRGVKSTRFHARVIRRSRRMPELPTGRPSPRRSRSGYWGCQSQRDSCVRMTFKAQIVLDTCRNIGVAVPEQIAVIGVDNDTLLCELSHPSLTSVAPAWRGAGFHAAQLLDGLMNGRVGSGLTSLLMKPLGIVQRQSTDITAVSNEDIAAAIRFN